ncbi:MAG: hypothetical protein ACRELE_04920, partial [Gemmatimonadales bacterium]
MVFIVTKHQSDGSARPASDKAVTLTVTAGNGTVGGAASTTITSATDGSVATTWVLGSTIGTQTLRGAVSATDFLDVHIDVLPKPQPSQLVIATAPSASPISGVPIFSEPVVQLQDGLGNRVQQAGVAVTVSTANGTPLLSLAEPGRESLTVATDAAGQATFHDLVLTGGGTTALQFSAPGLSRAISGPMAVIDSATATPLSNAVQLGPATWNSGALAYYTFQAPIGTLSIDVATFGGSGNAELFVRAGINPTTADFDCHAAVTGPSQICILDSNLTMPYDIVVMAATPLVNSRIRANAYNAGCTPKGAITLGTPISGTLTAATGCLAEQLQSLHDRYTLTIPTAQALTLTASSSSDTDRVFVAYRQPANQLEYWLGFGVTPTVHGPLLLGAGTYTVLVGDDNGSGNTRNYTVTFTATPPSPVGCQPIFPASSALSITLALTSLDCAGTAPNTLSHRAWIILGTGQSVTVTMASSAFDPLINVISGFTRDTGTIMASDDNGGGGTTAQLTFTNTDSTDDARITIELTSAT